MLAQGRLVSPEEFGNIVVRETPDGGTVRLRDVARMELGSQDYSVAGRFNGRPGAIIAAYQLPGSNAVDAAAGVKKLMAQMKERFPDDIDFAVSLDTTLSVTEGLKEIVETLLIALVLVIIVVYLFLQSWRSTLIPLLAVPVSLIGTFVLFPLFGFSINTLSLFGLVLAIGLVVDDAIVVVEGVERHIEEGIDTKECRAKGDGGTVGSGGRNRPGSLGGIRAHGLDSRNHRQTVPAIRGHHCHLRGSFRLQRTYPQPCTGRAAASTARREPTACCGDSSIGLTGF